MGPRITNVNSLYHYPGDPLPSFWCSERDTYIYMLLASERSERDTLSLSSMKNAIRIYIYIYIYRYVRHTLVARSRGDVMWEELSDSHF